jgi:hypothetical protein
MSEMTHEEALRLAGALAEQRVRETEARCRVLAQFIDDCNRAGSRTSAWSDAHGELRALHDYRDALLRKRGLIQAAMECAVGESPAQVQLTPPPRIRPEARTQQQVQIQMRRRRA